jgi:protein SCO1/2
MKLKWIFLFFILGLPVCIYLFLKSFGENKFDVPIFYEDGITNPVSSCSDTSSPFEVPSLIRYDSAFQIVISGLTILDIGTSSCDSCRQKINNLLSVWDRYKDFKDFKMYSLIEGENSGSYDNPNINWSVYNSSTKQLTEMANCVLNLDLIHSDQQRINKNGVVVLVDDKRRIRGYYNVFDRKEADRLAIELEIIRTE